MYLNKVTDKVDEEDINKFKESMDDDFNVQNVLTLLNDIQKAINVSLRNKDYDTLAIKTNTFKTILDVLGIQLFIEQMNDEQLDTYRKWMAARDAKDFETADIYRNKLISWNIL